MLILECWIWIYNIFENRVDEKYLIMKNLSLKVKGILFVVLMSILGCKKENYFDVENLYNLKFFNSYETYALVEPVNDTIYYWFQPNGEMLKIGRDYSIKNGAVKLTSIDTIKYSYWMDKDFLYWHLHPSENGKLLPIFGQDNGEWKILKLNSDTMVVDLYYQKKKFGHMGFKALK